MKPELQGVEPLGDRALLIRFANRPSAQLTAHLMGVAGAARALSGVVDASPGLTTVLIEAESQMTEALLGRIPSLVARAVPVEGVFHEVALRYDGRDLDWVCDYLHLSPEELASRHSRPVYDVRLLGSPGFIYLSDVEAELALPRLQDPRQEVPQGSVGIAGVQTGIYGLARPGGWRIIGTVSRVPRVHPGDRVRFQPS